jgi:hypothetical protein
MRICTRFAKAISSACQHLVGRNGLTCRYIPDGGYFNEKFPKGRARKDISRLSSHTFHERSHREIWISILRKITIHIFGVEITREICRQFRHGTLGESQSTCASFLVFWEFRSRWFASLYLFLLGSTAISREFWWLAFSHLWRFRIVSAYEWIGTRDDTC